MGKATRWLKGLFGITKEKGPADNSKPSDQKNKKGIGSTGLCENPATIPPNITPAEASWLKSFYNHSENEQSKHAIAVAAATAAAADAAVAAAQAAVAVVRLTSNGRGTMFGGARERWAALKIQTCFRGYLSRKALRALKGLVKLQALVRGYLVRKQANETLRSMQALVRAQASVRAQKARGSIKNVDGSHSQFRGRKSMERFDDTRSESIHSRRLSASFESTICGSPKIVEVDTGRPKSRSRRTNTWASDSNNNPYSHTHSSPLTTQTPARLSIPNCPNCHDTDWGLTGDECRFSTPQSTPRPIGTPKSVCGESFFRRYANFPNYMASTQSYKNKVRSQSAPKQRPEVGPKKRLSLNELMESRSSLSGVKMQRSCSRAQEVIDFKSAVMGNFDRSLEVVRAPQRDYYMEGKW